MIRYDPQQATFYRDKLIERVKEDVTECYQCGNCTAGCPAAFTFDYPPNKMMRMLQVGMVDEVLSSKSVQLCIQCLTCTARCPRDIDIAGIIEDLKTIAVVRNMEVPEDADKFNRLFLQNIAKYGRLSEAMLLLRFNLASHKLMNDAELGIPMMSKGKLQFVPRKSGGADEVGRIYKKALERSTWES